MRDLQLVLLAEGGAELIEVKSAGQEGVTIWASDSDPDFAEEFPELLDENDIEHMLDYLEDREELGLTERELEACDIMAEPLEDADTTEDDDCDSEEEWADDGDDDVIEGEFEEHE